MQCIPRTVHLVIILILVYLGVFRFTDVVTVLVTYLLILSTNKSSDILVVDWTLR